MSPAILVFLAQFGCHPSAAVEVIPDKHLRGTYRDGVVRVRHDADDGVLVHELVHDCQFRKRGRAKSSDEWFQREREAAAIEKLWREEQ